nr:ribonuclease H-like domain-containing protein [Tanacetum cinerariifolium]
NLETNKVILSRHVTFDETQFPYKSMTPSSPPLYEFLDTHPSPLLSSLASNTPNSNTTHQPAPNSSPHSTPTPNSNQAQSTSIYTPTTSHPLGPLPDIHITQPQPSTAQPNPPAQPPKDPPRTHKIVTRSQSGIVKPLERFSLHAASISPIPKTLFVALQNSHWRQSMLDNYNVLIKNGTWILVPKPAGVNMVRSVWLFKHKFHANGTLSRYNARLVANGSSQQQGINVDDTFSPVVKPATIRTVLSLAVSCKWPIHQLDVKNAFLNGLFLSQKKYACELLERANMVNCNPLRTPVHTDSKLGPEGVAVQDPTLYRSLAGGLQYLTFTRPDLSYAIQQICLYMHDPWEPHFDALKRILRYVRVLWTSVFSFMLPLPPPSLGDNLLSWSSKRHNTISRSSAEAKYRGVANVVAETAWLRNLLCELHSPLSIATLVYCDNGSAVYLSANPVQHQRTKYIKIDIHFVCDMVQTSHIRVLHVPSRYQYADIFTKGPPTALFEDFRSSLSVRLPPAQTTRAY